VEAAGLGADAAVDQRPVRAWERKEASSSTLADTVLMITPS
jgi:hypothetical protein